jgi:hypothetical protein
VALSAIGRGPGISVVDFTTAVQETVKDVLGIAPPSQGELSQSQESVSSVESLGLSSDACDEDGDDARQMGDDTHDAAAATAAAGDGSEDDDELTRPGGVGEGGTEDDDA